MSTLGAGRGGSTSSALVRTQKAFSHSPSPPVGVLKNNFHTHAQQMLVKLATRAAQQEKKRDSNTNKKKAKNWEKENGKRQENWLQKMLMIYLIDLTRNICKDRSACEK